jgi:hypothetical protein
MNTIVAALQSSQRLAGRTHSWRRIWEHRDLVVIIAFSLIGLVAALSMSALYPPPEGAYTELMAPA